MRARNVVALSVAAVAVVAVLLRGAFAGYGGRTAPLSPAVDAEQAALLADAARQIRSSGADAVTPLDAYRREDPDNAFGHYLLAAAYARQGGWEAATEALRRGNRAPHCRHYAPRAPYARQWEAVAPLRSMGEDVRDAALSLPGREAGEFLFECRSMADRVSRAEPASLALAEAGALMHRDFARATAVLAQRAGDDLRTDDARKEEKADQSLLGRVRAKRKALFAPGGPLNADRLRARYGLTGADAAALADGRALEDADAKTADALAAEWDAAERAAVRGLLPDAER